MLHSTASLPPTASTLASTSSPPTSRNGEIYQALPITAEGFELTGKGTLPRPKLAVSNIAGTISTLLTTLPEGLQGAKVTRIRTLGRYLDAVNFPGSVNPTADPYAEFPAGLLHRPPGP